jgi:quercetin dioxygenase-like cupin family protein
MKRAPNQPVGELVLYAGIFCKVWSVLDADTLMPQHAHEHPHISAILSGTVRVWQDDQDLGKFHAPAFIKIPALVKHKFLTLTDNVMIACIHNADHADPDGEPLISERADLELED